MDADTRRRWLAKTHAESERLQAEAARLHEEARRFLSHAEETRVPVNEKNFALARPIVCVSLTGTR